MSLPVRTSDSRIIEMNGTSTLSTEAGAAVNQGEGFLLSWLKTGSIRPCSLRRAEEAIRMGREYSFVPKVLSIGPLHHGNQLLKEVEDLKAEILEDFWGTKDAPEHVSHLIGEKVLNSYPKNIQEKYGSDLDGFGNMCFKDASVALYVIDIVANRRSSSILGRITFEHCITDLLLLENQLPLPLLNLLNAIKFGKNRGDLNVIKFLYAAMSRRLSGALPQPSKDLFVCAPHLVALLQKLCVPSDNPPSNYPLLAFSAKELVEKGVSILGIQPNETEGLLGGRVEFSESSGTLCTPSLNIYNADRFKISFLNMMAYESLLGVNSNGEVTKFIHANAALLRDSSSVEIGREKFVSTRYSNETIATLFKDMTANSCLNFEVPENAQGPRFGVKCTFRKWRTDFYDACLKSPRLIFMTFGPPIFAYGAFLFALVQLFVKLSSKETGHR